MLQQPIDCEEDMMWLWKLFGSISILVTCLPTAFSQGEFGKSLNGRQASLTINTSSGPIIGHAAPRKPDVSEYLGIPFAAAPTGDLRFAAPVAYRSNGSAILADSYVR